MDFGYKGPFTAVPRSSL